VLAFDDEVQRTVRRCFSWQSDRGLREQIFIIPGHFTRD